jgi:hypothetical protein
MPLHQLHFHTHTHTHTHTKLKFNTTVIHFFYSDHNYILCQIHQHPTDTTHHI